MKKILTALVLMAMVLVIGAQAEPYSMTTIVVDLDYDNDVVTVMDFNENLWEFYGCEDWFLMDVCSMTLESNDTDSIYDDEIIDARCDGWIDGWLERLGY